MSLNISSESISNPLLVDLLRNLSHVFSQLDSNFFVIGATARDLILHALAGTAARRKTRDLDIAIAITGWDSYDKILQRLIDAGYTKSTIHTHRLNRGDYEIDIVPYGAVAKNDGNIYWPPDETIAMSVKGFDEVLREAVTVSIDGEFEIRIASLHGLFVLKLNAWLDRNLTTNKDAEDMWYIIDNYYYANEARGIHQEVYGLDSFDLAVAGAYWMAHDIADLLEKRQIGFYNDILKKELARAADSRLVMQILDTHRLLNLSEVLRVLSVITDVFTERQY